VSEPWYRWDGDTLTIKVRVQPRASKVGFSGIQNGELKIKICAPPVEGKANDEVIRFLATTFKVARKDIELVHGFKGRSKRFSIRNPGVLPDFIVRPGQV